MSMLAISFTDEEKEQILAVMEAVSAEGADAWLNDELAPVRSRIKAFYLAAQQNRCCYCDKVYRIQHGAAWDVEHVVPRSLRGEFTFEPKNLAVSCKDCNGHKSNRSTLKRVNGIRYPRSSRAFLIVHPHFDRMREHILWVSESLCCPLSDKGTWTIMACRLHRFIEQELKLSGEISDTRFEAQVQDVFVAETPEEAERAVSSLLSQLSGVLSRQQPSVITVSASARRLRSRSISAGRSGPQNAR